MLASGEDGAEQGRGSLFAADIRRNRFLREKEFQYFSSIAVNGKDKGGLTAVIHRID
jgi:hypothetical protein